MNLTPATQADIASPAAKRWQQMLGQAVRRTGRAILAAVRAFVNFWNIPALGKIDSRRSPLLRENWYM